MTTPVKYFFERCGGSACSPWVFRTIPAGRFAAFDLSLQDWPLSPSSVSHQSRLFLQRHGGFVAHHPDR